MKFPSLFLGFILLLSLSISAQRDSTVGLTLKNNLGLSLAEGPNMVAVSYERLLPTKSRFCFTLGMLYGLAIPADEWGQTRISLSDNYGSGQEWVYANVTPRTSVLFGDGKNFAEVGLGLHMQWPGEEEFSITAVPRLGYRLQLTDPFPAYFRFSVDWPLNGFTSLHIPVSLGFGTSF